MLSVGVSEPLAFLVDVAGGLSASVEAIIAALVPLKVRRSISLDPVSEFQELVGQLQRLLAHVGGFIQMSALQSGPVGGHHGAILVIAGVVLRVDRLVAEVGRGVGNRREVSFVERAIVLIR